MKKISAVILAALLLCTGCSESGSSSSESSSSGFSSSEKPPQSGNTSSNSSNSAEAGGNSRVLIAYFTVPEDDVDTVARASVVVKDGKKYGNTEYVANLIQQSIGGDLFAIEAVKEYTHNHDALTDYALEEKGRNERPELKNHIGDISKYDTIILGYPNWWADLPMPAYTFFDEYDLAGKTIIPFVTHGGSGFSNTRRTIAELEPNAKVSDKALNLSRNDLLGNEDEITSWAKSLDINS